MERNMGLILIKSLMRRSANFELLWEMKRKNKVNESIELITLY